MGLKLTFRSIEQNRRHSMYTHNYNNLVFDNNVQRQQTALTNSALRTECPHRRMRLVSYLSPCTIFQIGQRPQCESWNTETEEKPGICPQVEDRCSEPDSVPSGSKPKWQMEAHKNKELCTAKETASWTKKKSIEWERICQQYT